MADAAVVAGKLEQIEQYHGELQEKQALTRDEFLEDVTQQVAAWFEEQSA